MTPTFQRHFLLGLILLLTLAGSSRALAERGAHDDAARAAARTAGYEGIASYDSGDFNGAVDKLGRAYGVVKVPTLGVWYARALAKIGKLVEASERYGEVLRLEINEGKIKEQKRAQAEAAVELEALRPRIPTLTITVEGASSECEVLLNGEPLPTKLLGLATPVNPGQHQVQANQGSQVVGQNVKLTESERKAVTLRLKPESASPTRKAASGGAAGLATENQIGSNADHGASNRPVGSTQKTIGWISLGLGGAATAAGAITGLLAISKRNDMDDSDNCRGTECLTLEHNLLTSYNQMRTVSTIGFVVGAVGIAAGTTLLLTTPKPKEATVHAWLGVGSAGIGGAF